MFDERLAGSCQVDGPLSIVYIHEKEDDPRLQIALYVVDDDLLSNIDDLDVGEGWLFNRLVECCATQERKRLSRKILRCSFL